jgi:hypothetical protein
LAVLLFFAVPFGLSVSGCKHALAVQYCNGGDAGPVVGQVATISLSPTLAVYGESLDYGQIGQTLNATAQDCKGNSVSVRSFTYASTDGYTSGNQASIFADINPSTGSVCAGTWNRNTGGGINDYTTCTPPPSPPPGFLAYVTATGEGASSNAIPVYVHPAPTSIPIGAPSASCLVGTEPVTGTTAIGSFSVVGVSSTTNVAAGQGISGPGIPATTSITAVNTTANTLTISNAATAAATNVPLTIIGNPTSNCCPYAVTAPGNPQPYTSNSACLSQGQTAQLVASVYDNNSTYAGNNITCQVGHLTFSPVGATNVATIDQNGIITANQPGSAIITAAITASGSGTTSGFFSTCPPASIILSATGQPAPTPGVTQDINVNLNVPQSFSTTVYDTNHNPITGLSLEYESTNQQTVPASGNSATPLFPGSGTITAVCQPGTCNLAPFSQINYQGNGVALTSNGITVNTSGTSSEVIYIGSTSSQYLYPVDFTTNQPATLLKLPYVPNSMVINEAGSEIYLGSSQGLMTVSTANNTLSSTNTTVVGSVISVSPDSSTLIVTDPSRQTITLVTSSGTVTTTYGGVATHASWSPDSQTVYITAGNMLLVHSAYTNWTAIPVTTTGAYTDVTVTVPHVGAYFAGGTLTDGRSYCPSTTLNAGSPPTTVNSFYPLADEKAAPSDRIVATTDGNHILSATAGLTTTPATPPALNDINVAPDPTSTNPDPLKATLECPVAPATVPNNYFTSTYNPATNSHPLTGVTATAITGVTPSTNSAVAFVTYTGTGTAGSQLPMYIPSTGTLSFVSLPGATAPISGVFSTDNLTFYAGTSGDNLVHEVAVTYPTTGNPTAAQSGTINPTLPCGVGNIAAPNLTCTTGSIVAPNLIVQRPKKSTN